MARRAVHNGGPVGADWASGEGGVECDRRARQRHRHRAADLRALRGLHELFVGEAVDPASNGELDPGDAFARLEADIRAGVERLLSPEIVARSELTITNASGIHAQPIAEHAFGLILMYVRNLHLAAQRQHEAEWQSAPYRESLRTLQGRTLGVLGLGAIGEKVAQIGAAFGLRVIGLKRTPHPAPHVSEVFGPEQRLGSQPSC